VLVLLCQGLLFQSSEDTEQVILAFGVLVMLILCFCLALTVYSVAIARLKPQSHKRFLLKRAVARRLPRELLLEFYFLYSLGKLDFEREIELDMDEIRSMMTKAEYQETKTAIESMDDTPAMIRAPSLDGEGGTENLLGRVLPTRAGGALNHQMLESQNLMLNQFSQTIAYQQ
jgi:hypothetical protein